MAIELVLANRRGEELRVVSSRDGAIDWDSSFGGDKLTLEAKKDAFMLNHDARLLVYKEEQQPTFFVFQHPKRVDVARKIRGLLSQSLTAKEQNDLFTEIFEKAYLGTQDGPSPISPPPRSGQRIADQYYQALEDKGVLVELANAFMAAASDRNAEVDEKK